MARFWHYRLLDHHAWLPIVLVIGVGGCDSSRPWVELEPDRFTAASPMDPWVAPPELGYEAPRVAPLAAPAASTLRDLAGEQSLLNLASVALERNPQTRAVWQQSLAAAAEYGQTRAEWYPVVGLEADFYYQRYSGPAENFALDVNQTQVIPSIGLTYVLLDFGRREADDDRARQTLWAANLTFNRQVQQTLYDVQNTYFRHDEAIGLYDAAVQNLQLAETVVEAVEDRLLLGLSTRPELLLVRQELAKARFDLEATTADIYATKANLLEVLGYPATIELEIARLSDDPLPEALGYRVQEVIDVALRDRPDLAAAVSRVRATEAAVRRAEAEFNPEVSLMANVGYDWTSFSTDAVGMPAPNRFDYSDQLPVWAVNLTGSWIIFEGFARENAVREARALRAAAEAELETLRLRAIGEVWTDYYEFLASRKQFDYGQALLASSQEAYDAVLESYEVGLATITELLAAERDLAAARSTVVTTRADLLVATAALSLSTGSGTGRAPQPKSASTVARGQAP